MRKPFFLLWILCILGSLSVLPYVYYLQLLPTSISLLKVAILGGFQAALLFGLLCWLSSKILPKTDLRPFSFDKKILLPAIISGILVGLTLVFFDQIFSSPLTNVRPPIWTGALASLYGAINEEVSLRLFLFTLVYFLIGKCIKIRQGNRTAILWATNIFVALLFGVGHLPAAAKLIPLVPFEVFRILFLNGIAGAVFGWLYWTRGLWAAMVAHFIADLMIHVFLR